MRYAGGGIGHYKVDLMEGSRDSAPPPEPEPTASIHAGDANFQTADDAATNVLGTGDNADDCPHVDEDSESDREDLQSGSDSESEGSDIDDNFWAEDGDEVFGDVEDKLGYAEL